MIAPPGAPKLLGWTWEIREGVPVFGEAAYAGRQGGHARVRTWRSLPEGGRGAIAAHLVDLAVNAEAGTTAPDEFAPIDLLIDAVPRLGQVAGFGRFRFVVCEIESVLVTMASPAGEPTPALVRLAL